MSRPAKEPPKSVALVSLEEAARLRTRADKAEAALATARTLAIEEAIRWVDGPHGTGHCESDRIGLRALSLLAPTHVVVRRADLEYIATVVKVKTLDDPSEARRILAAMLGKST